MATDRIDATCSRLRASRANLVELVHSVKGDRSQLPDTFPRSYLMRALTGAPGRRALGNAAMAFAIAKPATVWRLAGILPVLRPMVFRFLSQRLLRSRDAASRHSTPIAN